MKTTLHKANTRGHANHGWLDTNHTFSFAHYYDPTRMNFGALRVLNDDVVEGGMGFGTHRHDNMEIISIPLLGDLEHRDSMGNTTIIKQSDVQIMSAGSGVSHSEYNRNKDKKVNFLQIWVFPKVKDIKPRYDQKTFSAIDRINKWQPIVSPSGIEGSVRINQDAWFHLSDLTKDTSITYRFKEQGSGLYAFAIEGAMEIANTQVERRDGLGVWDTNEVMIKALDDSKLLLMEVPMLD